MCNFIKKCKAESEKIINSINEIRTSILKLKQNLKFSSKDIIAYLFANGKNINEKEDNENNISILNLNSPKLLECINDSSLPICQ